MNGTDEIVRAAAVPDVRDGEGAGGEEEGDGGGEDAWLRQRLRVES